MTLDTITLEDALKGEARKRRLPVSLLVRNVLVTGASSGLGRALAAELSTAAGGAVRAGAGARSREAAVARPVSTARSMVVCLVSSP